MNLDKGHNVFVNSDFCKFFVYFYCHASHMNLLNKCIYTYFGTHMIIILCQEFARG